MSNDLHLVKWARDAQLAQSCFRRHRIYDYKPGWVRYTFGHYPTRNPYYPTNADWEQLDMFCENGVEMLIVFEEWSDVCGYFGKQPDRYFKYLRIYRQMTKPNTIVYIEVHPVRCLLSNGVKATEGERFPLTEDSRRVSVFVNDSLWVAIGHLGTEPQKVRVRSLQGDDEGETVTLNPRSLTVLRYYDLRSLPEVIQFS